MNINLGLLVFNFCLFVFSFIFEQKPKLYGGKFLREPV
ncbi:hypothetical protein P278_11670 [Zhouia amylolytica AD3]|uniref:Uncharacterized protein n=1 Tax=Zhouia amylolytica AD3 TaxID=1286632 RepID=W2UMQ7_9FLAO|nr:hypothetical protein P278_11670 [Zhouia amylolytica AD3]